MLNPLDVARVKRELNTAYMGRTLVYGASLASTNDLAQTLAYDGAPEGTLVIADHQNAGKGRLGRRWLSPANANLLMSLLFRPELEPLQAQRLTMICSLAMADAIAETTGLEARIKWPNDVLLGGKKAGGILTELGLSGPRLDYVIVGIGLNVNLALADLPDELQATATSVALEYGAPVEREALLLAFLSEVEWRNEALKRGVVPREEWTAKLATLGQWVTVSAAHGDEVAEALAETVDEDGALLLRLRDGATRRVLAGDVTLRPPKQDAPT